MSFSRRVSLQWIPDQEKPEEKTSTYVLTAPNNEFVDIRIYKSHYPYLQHKGESFEKVFEWGITGIEEPIEGTRKINFNHEISTVEVIKSIKTGKPLEECRGEPDIGDFSAIEGSEDRKEIGTMVNFDTGIETDYIEIWRSLDPNRHNPSSEVREPKEAQEPLKVLVMNIEQEGFQGKLVRLGNWLQGLALDRTSKELHVIRYHFDTANSTWERLIQYGSLSFPVDFVGAPGDSITLDNVKWICKDIK